ncbi:MAG: hypothetical protein ACOC3T_04830 [Bacteroidota bacterium]
MKLTKIFSLVILTLCTAIYGFFENQKIIYKNSSFIVSTNLNIDKDSVDTINIEKQLEIVDTVFNWLLCPDFKDSLPKPLLVYMTKLDGLISFQSKSSDRVVTIDNNNMVKKIWNTPCARKITEIEYEYFRKHNKLIPGMKIISEQDAIKEARTFFTKLLRYYDLQGDISNYDSVIVNLHLGHNCYVVRFLAKIKN